MNTPRFLTALALLPATIACAGVIPEPFPAARYEKMLTDSPFALATTPNGPSVPPEPSWSANLILGPVYRIVRDGEEREYAVVKSKGDISGSFTLTGHDEGPDGIQLVKIEWADDITKTKAVVKKGAEFATLEADQTAVPTVPVQQIIQPRPNGQPGVPNMATNPNAIRRPGQPAVPSPVIPRPTTAVPPVPPQYNQNNQNNQNPNDRRRIRVINSK